MATVTFSKKLNKEARVFIVHAVQEILSDPDFGLTVTAKVRKRLQNITIRKQPTISFSEIKKRHY